MYIPIWCNARMFGFYVSNNTTYRKGTDLTYVYRGINYTGLYVIPFLDTRVRVKSSDPKNRESNR